MDPAYGAEYARLYHHHWWWRTRERAILRELRQLRPSRGWKRVLDVGSGDGLFFARLAEFGEVEGVEPETALVAPDSPWRDRIHVLPFDERFQPGRRFDVILFLDVLEHLDDPGQALRHAVSLLENGGIILATVPAFMWLWTAHDDLNHHRTRYDRRSLRSVMESAGLRVERTRYLFQWLVGAKLLVRGIEAVRRPEPSSPSIPPAPINGMLTGVSAVEEWLGRFLPPPFGGSLLMVARPVESSAATTGE
jgi:SAM-dependent methyltransferase